jgi:predicted N-acetyltransferase YhbS
MSTARFRRSYAEDPGLADRIFELLETWFTGIGKPRRAAAQLGSRWDDCSTPFVYEKDGRIVSHVGLLEMPYVIKGERHQLGGVHGVCTLESERRQGHFRRIMEELLEYCDSRFETLELGTENPEYYEPFGFRVVPEHHFVASVAFPGGDGGFRAFDPARGNDLGSLDRLLRERTPVSMLVGVVEELDVFKFSQGTRGLHYSEALDCFAVFELDGPRLVLGDVVARELPSLERLLAQIGRPVEEVEFHFSPDRFRVAARPEPFRYDGDHYMVRGPFTAEGEPFMVPPPARH